jgi:hypothetical protein
MPGDHALLSPSKAKQWIKCTPSARVQEFIPEEESEYAREGTLAHTLAELLLGYKLGRVIKKVYKDQLAAIKDDPLYTSEMWGHCEDYVIFVLEKFNERLAEAHRGEFNTLELETKINLQAWAPESFGRLDISIVSEPVLEIIDYKYGEGVAVYAEHNEQLMIYALGALDVYLGLYDIKTVRLNIYQPRLKNISSWEISVEDLLLWGETVVKPQAIKAFAGEGEFVAGSHCKFCKFDTQCKALAEYNLEVAKEEFDDLTKLSDADIVNVLERADSIIKWVNKMKDYALSESLHHGKTWPGFKMVTGISRSKIIEDKALKEVTKRGFGRELVLNEKLKSQEDLREIFGLKLFNDIFGPYTVKPKGAPVLVPLADKRVEINSLEEAAADFPDDLPD